MGGVGVVSQIDLVGSILLLVFWFHVNQRRLLPVQGAAVFMVPADDRL